MNLPSSEMSSRYPVTPRSKVKRLPKRGSAERAQVYAILDAHFLCHIGYVIEGQPYVTPTGYWRHGDRVYWHGSSASRMLRAQTAGLPVCLTVTLLDGLVLARSGFHHSINYRSVMAFGQAGRIEDPVEKEAALNAYVERALSRPQCGGPAHRGAGAEGDDPARHDHRGGFGEGPQRPAGG